MPNLRLGLAPVDLQIETGKTSNIFNAINNHVASDSDILAGLITEKPALVLDYVCSDPQKATRFFEVADDATALKFIDLLNTKLDIVENQDLSVIDIRKSLQPSLIIIGSNIENLHMQLILANLKSYIKKLQMLEIANDSKVKEIANAIQELEVAVNSLDKARVVQTIVQVCGMVAPKKIYTLCDKYLDSSNLRQMIECFQLNSAFYLEYFADDLTRQQRLLKVPQQQGLMQIIYPKIILYLQNKARQNEVQFNDELVNVLTMLGYLNTNKVKLSDAQVENTIFVLLDLSQDIVNEFVFKAVEFLIWQLLLNRQHWILEHANDISKYLYKANSVDFVNFLFDSGMSITSIFNEGFWFSDGKFDAIINLKLQNLTDEDKHEIVLPQIHASNMPIDQVSKALPGFVKLLHENNMDFAIVQFIADAPKYYDREPIILIKLFKCYIVANQDADSLVFLLNLLRQENHNLWPTCLFFLGKNLISNVRLHIDLDLKLNLMFWSYVALTPEVCQTLNTRDFYDDALWRNRAGYFATQEHYFMNSPSPFTLAVEQNNVMFLLLVARMFHNSVDPTIRDKISESAVAMLTDLDSINNMQPLLDYLNQLDGNLWFGTNSKFAHHILDAVNAKIATIKPTSCGMLFSFSPSRAVAKCMPALRRPSNTNTIG